MASVGVLRDSIGDSFGLKDLRKKYVPAETSEDVIEIVVDLASRGYRSSLHHLCDDLESSKAIGESRTEIQTAMGELNSGAMDICLAFGMRQAGFSLSQAAAKRNAVLMADRFIQEMKAEIDHYETRRQLCIKVKGFDPEDLGPRRHFMMIDIEDLSHVQGALEVQRGLNRHGAPTGITVYACLERARADAMLLIASRSVIRLTPGECKDPKLGAMTSQDDVDSNFLGLAGLLLCDEAKINNIYPIFSVLDEELIEGVESILLQEEWEKGSYEFELPYGVKTDLASRLLDKGHRVRLRIPFGNMWWPYVEKAAVWDAS
ncbi:MAG: hypothetical protein OQJ97_07765 [Rhodospirillales bacterium]|nr:hypothetical protein [Rhodospirillales bacterium]